MSEDNATHRPTPDQAPIRSRPSFLDSLVRRVVAAPMAGGPSTPELVAAAAAAGGIGFLGAGYQTPEQLASDIAAVRDRSPGSPFGVNLFVSLRDDAAAASSPDDVIAYAAKLQPFAEEVGARLPDAPTFTDFQLNAKIDLLVADPVPVISFTFGAPDAETVARLHGVGTQVAVTVTAPADAETAARCGADALVLQGAQAGGHRSTFAIGEAPNSLGTLDLVAACQAQLDAAVNAGGLDARPALIASGGIHSAEHARAAFAAGVDAVQIGTALLCTREAGTSAAYCSALEAHFASGTSSAEQRSSTTVVTRVWSGRPARAIENRMVAALNVSAPAAYPMSNALTRPIRTAAGSSGRPDAADFLSLWAGDPLPLPAAPLVDDVAAHSPEATISGGAFHEGAGAAVSFPSRASAIDVIAAIWDGSAASRS